ncbi:unnamed protein product [Mytilus edulis]|uniref:Uncharacterized protein n=1 Tax=Mytilus edulis TaxID=6550 RepID=A0A8S3R2B4_MYTED|nr:unnamed protein product [Mytilus edulis]
MAYQTRKIHVKYNHDDICSSGSETESSESTSLTLKKKEEEKYPNAFTQKLQRIEINEEVSRILEKQINQLQKSRLSKDRHKLRVTCNFKGSGNRCTKTLRKRKNNLGNRKKSLGRTFTMRYKTWNKYAKTDMEPRSDALTKEEIDDSHNTYLKEATPLSQTKTVDNHGHQKHHPLPLPSFRPRQSEESVEPSCSGELTDHHQVNSPTRSTDSRDSLSEAMEEFFLDDVEDEDIDEEDLVLGDEDDVTMVYKTTAK